MNLPDGGDGSITTIGMFDSGVGGLSVLRQLEHLNGQMPLSGRVRFIYLGDTARCPYGNRQPKEIVVFAKQIVDWLINAGADRIVIACNTSAARAGSTIRVRSSVPIHDLITPTAEHVAKLDGKVAVLATHSTVRSAAFSKAIARLNPSLDVIEIACPELVPLVESGQIKSATARNVLWNYVKDFDAQQVRSIVLGCTHYPFLAEPLRSMLPAQITLIDPADYLLATLQGALTPGSGRTPPGNYHDAVLTKFFVTGSTVSFAQTAAICLGRELPNVLNLTVDELTGSRPYEPIAEAAVAANAVSHVISPASS